MSHTIADGVLRKCENTKRLLARTLLDSEKMQPRGGSECATKGAPWHLLVQRSSLVGGARPRRVQARRRRFTLATGTLRRGVLGVEHGDDAAEAAPVAAVATVQGRVAVREGALHVGRVRVESHAAARLPAQRVHDAPGRQELHALRGGLQLADLRGVRQAQGLLQNQDHRHRGRRQLLDRRQRGGRGRRRGARGARREAEEHRVGVLRREDLGRPPPLVVLEVQAVRDVSYAASAHRRK